MTAPQLKKWAYNNMFELVGFDTFYLSWRWTNRLQPTQEANIKAVKNLYLLRCVCVIYWKLNIGYIGYLSFTLVASPNLNRNAHHDKYIPPAHSPMWLMCRNIFKIQIKPVHGGIQSHLCRFTCCNVAPAALLYYLKLRASIIINYV